MDFNPIGIKYWGGWGDGSDASSSSFASAAGSVSDLFKVLKKYSKKDRQYLRNKWHKRYMFYATSLFDDEDQITIMNDHYMKKIDKELGLL